MRSPCRVRSSCCGRSRLIPGGRRGPAHWVLVRDVTELRRREEQLLTKDATIREIHHRVKNNLQTVAAPAAAAGPGAPPRRRRARHCANRYGGSASIALVHETLSQTLDESVAFDKIAEELVAMTVDVAATGPRPKVVPAPAASACCRDGVATAARPRAVGVAAERCGARLRRQQQ